MRKEAEDLTVAECQTRGKEARRTKKLDQARVYFEVAARKGHIPSKVSLGYMLSISFAGYFQKEFARGLE